MGKDFQNVIKDIYSHLGDDLSKDIFCNRLIYSLTGDMEYILTIVRNTDEGKEMYSHLKENKKKKVIFGAGIWGKNIINAYRDIAFECFVDNKVNASDMFYQGLPVISFNEYMEKYQDSAVVISSRLYHSDIYKQLKDAGVQEENIIDAGMLVDNMSKQQYFDLPQLQKKKTEEEVFIDGGSFDGKTSIEFIKWCNGKYKKIYVFEPDPKNKIKCKETLSEYTNHDNIEMIFKGLWDRKTELNFNSIANGSSKIMEDGKNQISTINMDEAVFDKVSFIKLDVEGAEYKALLGGVKIIQKEKPKLAISVYHKPEDIWELPKLIISLNPDYNLYLRHYSIAASETVLYAI